MSSSAPQATVTPAPAVRAGALVGALTPGGYVAVLALVALLAGGYSQRQDGLFACDGSSYSPDRYVSYCQSKSYGDYDYGAFWFDLEPKAVASAASASALIIGNSKTQMAFSTPATDSWFAGASSSFYLLGFSHNGNYRFAGPLLQKLHARPKVYILNLEQFFDSTPTGPARTVMNDPGAQARYQQKRMWRSLHRPICGAVPQLCGSQPAFMRSVSTGEWVQVGGRFESKAVSYDSQPDSAVVMPYVSAARKFLAQLQIDQQCVVLTMVPTIHTPSGNGRAIASGLGMELVAPEPDDLTTYDGIHLDPPSAEAWSQAFYRAAGARMQRCLARSQSPRDSPAALPGALQ